MEKLKKNIPNGITLLNLASGSVAIIMMLHGDAIKASWFILLAAAFDYMDGFFARLLKAKTDIGSQLDSLADVISFGSAPSLIMYTLIDQGFKNISPSPDRYFIWPFLSLLIVLASAYRLARFNNESAGQERFRGLPTPATGIFVASLPLAARQYTNNDFVTAILVNPYILSIVSIVLAWLMISNVSMMSLKFHNFSWRNNRLRIVLLLASIFLLYIFRYVGIALAIFSYVILSYLERTPKTVKPEK